MRREKSRQKASVLQPLRRRAWVRVVNRRDQRRYRRWRPKTNEEWPFDHWELIVRTMIERIGLDHLCEIIERVVIKMREDEIVAASDSARQIVLQAKPTVGD